MARLTGLNIRSGLVTQAALFIVHDYPVDPALFQRHHPGDQIRHRLSIEVLFQTFRHQGSPGVSQNFEFRSQQGRLFRFGSTQCQAAGRL